MFHQSYPQGNHCSTATWQVGNRQFLILAIILLSIQVSTSIHFTLILLEAICKGIHMATTVMSSLSLKPSPFAAEKSAAVRCLPSLARTTTFRVSASGGKKIKTDKPYGVNGSMDLRNGVDASGRKPKGKGVYQYVDKYGANVDGYSPIYNEDEWSPTGDVYAGGVTGLAIWAVTLLGILAGGALLVYNTSALSQ